MKSSRRMLVDGVDSDAMFRFPHVLRAAAHAMQPPRLLLGLFAVLFIMTLGGLHDAIVGPAALPSGVLSTHASDLEPREIDRAVRLRLSAYGLTDELEAAKGHLDAAAAIALLDAAARRERAGRNEWSDAQRQRYTEARDDLAARRPVGRFAATMVDIASELRHFSGGLLRADLHGAASAARRLLVELPARNWRESRFFAVSMMVIGLLVWAVVGGAVSRIAACDLAGGERIGVRDGMAFGVRRAPLLLGALALPLGLITALVLLLCVPALLLAVPWLGIISGALWFLALIAGCFAAFLIVVGIPAAPMLVPAVVCEHCDPVDALQRGFAGVLRRPLHLAGYVILWVIGLGAGFLVVSLLVGIAIRLPASLAASFSGAIEQTPVESSVLVMTEPGSAGRTPAVRLASFWSGLLALVVPAWLFSYLASGWTAIYMVLRRAADGRDLDEIWRPDVMPGTQVSVRSDHS